MYKDDEDEDLMKGFSIGVYKRQGNMKSRLVADEGLTEGGAVSGHKGSRCSAAAKSSHRFVYVSVSIDHRQ